MRSSEAVTFLTCQLYCSTVLPKIVMWECQLQGAFSTIEPFWLTQLAVQMKETQLAVQMKETAAMSISPRIN